MAAVKRSRQNPKEQLCHLLQDLHRTGVTAGVQPEQEHTKNKHLPHCMLQCPWENGRTDKGLVTKTNNDLQSR